MASIPHTPALARPAAPRRKPDPTRILQVYEYERRERGKPGAYRRAGEILGVSDETVRRAVHAHEQRASAPPEPDELRYSPPPGGYPEPEPAPQIATSSGLGTTSESGTSPEIATLTPQPAATATDVFMSSVADCEASERASVANATAETPRADIATRHTVERETTPATLPQIPPPAVVRVVIRERVEVGILAWVTDHPGLAKQLLALAVVIGLVVLTWMG